MKNLLIFYSHFAPAFKAGGPVQSLVNMVDVLNRHYHIYVVCSAYDMGERVVLPGITAGVWQAYTKNVSVLYTTGRGYHAVHQAIKKVNPEIVYINGMFLPAYNLYPLWLAQKLKCSIVMAPRGMLQRGALAIRPFKKKLFLKLFIFLNLHHAITWQATDDQERNDIHRVFGERAVVKLAPNIPKAPGAVVPVRAKNKGELHLVYLSLITEKKNLHLILEALKFVPTLIRFDIYGPVKDEDYWKQCMRLMEGQVHSIRYLGSVHPNEVQGVLSEYHALVLPTKGENFGHAIYEAFSVGTPAIISPYTPWGNLQSSQAGITIELNVHSLVSAITQFVDYDANEFRLLSLGAHSVALHYANQYDYEKLYKELFNRQQNN